MKQVGLTFCTCCTLCVVCCHSSFSNSVVMSDSPKMSEQRLSDAWKHEAFKFILECFGSLHFHNCFRSKDISRVQSSFA